MKAIAKLKIENSEKCGGIKWYEIKLSRKIVCKFYFPNIFHPNKFSAEFDTFTLSNMPLERAFKAVSKELHAMYGITEIEDKQGYPWELLEVFEDSLLADVTAAEVKP